MRFALPRHRHAGRGRFQPSPVGKQGEGVWLLTPEPTIILCLFEICIYPPNTKDTRLEEEGSQQLEGSSSNPAGHQQQNERSPRFLLMQELIKQVAL